VAGRLEGKRVLVTGAASGIGRATALVFLEQGARVGLLDLDAAGLETLVDSLGEVAAQALSLPADVTDEAQVVAAVRELVGRWGGLDVLVANAPIEPAGEDDRVDRLDLDVWRRVFDVNLTGIFLACKHAVRAMLAGGGSVICTASPTGMLGVAPLETAYSSSKAGVFGLTRVMAAALADDGIRVNAVVPGFTDTPLVASVMADTQRVEELLQAIPLRRQGTPEEVASMMLFLASDESRYATGGVFTVDGGLTAV
jgi:NAD(P)-dependent dehydrogenase (short-subunit alcohol dehydrogenase family)